MNRAFTEIEREFYKRRRGRIRTWAIGVNAKVQEVYGAQKEGAVKSYNGIYSLQTMYGFVDETEELLHGELRSGNTHPGGNFRRMERKVPLYRKKHIKRIRRCAGLVAPKVTSGGHQLRLKISVLHRRWQKFVYAWQRIPSLGMATGSG